MTKKNSVLERLRAFPTVDGTPVLETFDLIFDLIEEAADEIDRLKTIESLARDMISEMRLTPDGLIVKEKADKSDAHYRLCELFWPRPKVLRHDVCSQSEPIKDPT